MPDLPRSPIIDALTPAIGWTSIIVSLVFCLLVWFIVKRNRMGHENKEFDDFMMHARKKHTHAKSLAERKQGEESLPKNSNQMSGEAPL